MSVKGIFRYFLIVIVIPLLTVEVVCRAYFSYVVGPSIFLYGTRFHEKQLTPGLDRSSYNEVTGAEAKTFMHTMSKEAWRASRTVVAHENVAEGYTKYFPGQIRFDFNVDTGERFLVNINSSGFRGDDFTRDKPPDTIRVVTLGSSSTFGYFSRDDETYPAYLEAILNERFPGAEEIEVINLGIPHLRAAEIYQLFMREALELDPDVVTFYGGNNDASSAPMPGPRPVWMATLAFKEVGKYLITVGLIDSILDTRREILLSPADIEKRQAVSDGFVGSIAEINEECRKRGIVFIVGTQQRNSQLVEREASRGVTYNDEVRMVQAMVSRDQMMTFREYNFVLHAFLMESLKNWASAENVPLVDIIGQLDNDRDVLVSWVHLSPEGNRMVAEAFSEEILERITVEPND